MQTRNSELKLRLPTHPLVAFSELKQAKNEAAFPSPPEGSPLDGPTSHFPGPAPRPEEGTFQGANGLELFWQRWTCRDLARAVVAIVHGFGEHSGRYSRLVEYLVPRGYTVYGFDHRGHGRSPGRRGYITEWGEFRDDVDAFLDLIARQEPHRPVFLFGHSLGALIALEYTLHHPRDLQGLIVSGLPLGEIGLPRALFTLSRLLSRLWPTFSLDLTANFARLSRDPAIAEEWRADPLVHGRGTARLGTELQDAVVRTKARAGDVRLPLLMLHGAEDLVVPPAPAREFFARVIHPDKERHEYPGGYHEPHNDVDAERTFRDIDDWLDRHQPPEGAPRR